MRFVIVFEAAGDASAALAFRARTIAPDADIVALCEAGAAFPALPAVRMKPWKFRFVRMTAFRRSELPTRWCNSSRMPCFSRRPCGGVSFQHGRRPSWTPALQPTVRILG